MIDDSLIRNSWQPACVTSFASQCRYFLKTFPELTCLVQKGNQLLVLRHGAADPAEEFFPIRAMDAVCRQWVRARIGYALITEQGFLKGGMKRRVLRRLWLPHATVEQATDKQQYTTIPINPVQAWQGLYAIESKGAR